MGRVRCTNIRDQCPKLTCNDAISVPGQCCKVCPEQLKCKSENQENKLTPYIFISIQLFLFGSHVDAAKENDVPYEDPKDNNRGMSNSIYSQKNSSIHNFFELWDN